ncbi:MAG: Maf family protein [Thermodesulfobacteriota bacterium]
MNNTFIRPDFPLVLASASPRRRRLLEQAGLPFKAVPAEITENTSGSEPAGIACRLARQKAEAVSRVFPGRWIVGADTVVVLEESILGKPADREEARDMLERLSGRDHKVITGFSILAPPGDEVHTERAGTTVRFKPLESTELEGYLDTGEPFGKAGSYAIQGIGAFLVESIRGSYTNVVGLPLCALISALVSVRALERYPLRWNPHASSGA